MHAFLNKIHIVKSQWSKILQVHTACQGASSNNSIFNNPVLLFLVPLGVVPFLGADSFKRNWFSALGGLLVVVLLKLVFWIILVSHCNQYFYCTDTKMVYLLKEKAHTIGVMYFSISKDQILPILTLLVPLTCLHIYYRHFYL